jgi:M6 family metalloprotease-like protein
MARSSRPRAVAALASALFILGLLPLRALEPPTKEQLARYKRDGTLAARAAKARAFGNDKIPPRMKDRLNEKLARLTAGRKAVPVGSVVTPRSALSTRSALTSPLAVASIQAPPSAWQGLPTTGTVRILALLISFSDYAGATPAAAFESRLFGSGSGSLPYDSLANFYQRSSYGQLNITGDVLGWYQTSYARSTVAETDAGRQGVIKEALSHYDAQGFDFSPYDNDGDGAIDYFCVFWAGPHEDWADFWWGYYTSFTDSAFRIDGKRLSNYSWQWELYDYPNGSFTPSTIIHETGHALGAPDLYDYDDTVGPRGGVGGLDIMDYEGDHNCFTKFMFDWLTPTVVPSGSRTVTLRASGLYPDAALFMPAATGGIFGEFFMVQNRDRVGNDTNLFTGANGLVIWHIDSRLNVWSSDFLYDNSYASHKLVRLMEADGLEEIETSAAWADAGDYYRAGDTFGPETFPNSARYGGASTAMAVSGISGTTTPMSATISSTEDAPAVAITSPATGQTVYGTISVNVSASSDAGLGRVELYADAALVQTLTAGPYSFGLDTTTLANARHTLQAVAYDAQGLSGSSSVSVVVDNIYAPVDFTAVKGVNRSLLLAEYVNILTWSNPATSANIVSYRIYRDTGGGPTLLAEVAKGSDASHRYLDRGIAKAGVSVYEIVGVNASGREGPGAVATAR